MKFLRIGLILSFVAVCIATVMLYVSDDTDTTLPVIVCSTEEIEAKCDVDNEELLSYVTAFDEKDGDLTDSCLVESISGFIDFGVSQVTFAVSDNDNHVVKTTVRLRYTDYRNPVFSSTNDLLYNVGENADVSANITVRDSLDGNVSGWLIASADDFSTEKAGTYFVTYSVTTLKSYTYSLTLPVIVEERDKTQYNIALSGNIIYCDVGATLDYDSYVSSVVTPYNSADKANYTVSVDSSKVDLSKDGIYSAYYYVRVGGNVMAKTRLIILCGEIDNEAA